MKIHTKKACNLTGNLYDKGMAKKKVTAKRNRQSQSTTAKAVGIKSRNSAPTKAAVKARYAQAIATANKNGVKPPYEPTGKFLTAILRAWAVASLTEGGFTTSGKMPASEGAERRKFVRKVKAGKVTADLVVHANHKEATEGIGVFTDRPENTVRERLHGFCKVMGYPTDTLYAVRGEKYEKGEVVEVFIIRK